MPEYNIIYIGSQNYTNDFISEVIESAYVVNIIFLNPTEFLPKLELPQITSPHLIIFDINTCSGMGNAPENIQKLHQIFPKACILVINPYKKSTLVQPLIDAGAHAFLPATPSEKEIISIVDKLLQMDCSACTCK